MSERRTRLLLVRHGQTPWNADGRWQGHADPSLTAEGRKQAERLAHLLREQAARPWTRILSSDLARAQETAACVANRLVLPIELDLRLRELDVGAWSGLTRGEIERRDPDTLRAFEEGEPTVRPGGGESRLEIRLRTRDFILDLADRYEGQHLIVVTHLGVIRALVPGAEPNNTGQIEVVAEEIAARPIDRHRRPEMGTL